MEQYDQTIVENNCQQSISQQTHCTDVFEWDDVTNGHHFPISDCYFSMIQFCGLNEIDLCQR